MFSVGARQMHWMMMMRYYFGEFGSRYVEEKT